MAPVEPDLDNNNVRTIALLSLKPLIVGALLLHIANTVSRARKTLPPTQATRNKQVKRRKDLKIFSGLALFSLAIVSYFAVSWRVLSYTAWVEQSNEEVSNSLWTGWYGTGEDGMGLQLGRWWKDTDVQREGDARAVMTSKGFWWTQAQLSGLIAWSIFVGIEGMLRARNAPERKD